jgi:tetratricopeptide (TPR) repeat protein
VPAEPIEPDDRAARASATRWAAALLALVLAAFAPAWAYDFDRHEGFVWDDEDHYLHDPIVHDDDGWWRAFADPQPGIVGVEGGGVVWNYWPLTRLSFWLDLRLFGTREDGRPNLQGSHVMNVLLHAANAILLLLVLRGLGVPGAELGALLFAVHPVTVESVAWITERNGLLSACLALATLLAWLRFRCAPSPGRYGLVVGAFLLALLAKTTTVMLPVALVLIHESEGRPWTRRAVLRLAPLFAMSLVAGVTSIAFEGYIGSRGEAFETSFAERLVAAGWIPWFYLGKLVWPADLAFNYPRWEIDPGVPWAWLPGLALAAIGATLCVFRRSWARAPFLGVGAFVVLLFPVLGFFNVYGMRYAHVADHWVYLASVPALGLIAAGATVGFGRAAAALGLSAGATRWGACGLAAALTLLLAALTHAQSGAYVDRETLWRHTLERQPDSYLARNNLGVLLLQQKRYDEAIEQFEAALEADPTLPEPWVNVGNALDARGDGAAAVEWWEEAVRRDPEQATALFNLAVHRLRNGRVAEARNLLVAALEARPQYRRAFDLLASLYRASGHEAALAPFVERARAAGATPDDGRGGVAKRIGAAFALALALAAFVARGERGADARGRGARS